MGSFLQKKYALVCHAGRWEPLPPLPYQGLVNDEARRGMELREVGSTGVHIIANQSINGSFFVSVIFKRSSPPQPGVVGVACVALSWVVVVVVLIVGEESTLFSHFSIFMPRRHGGRVGWWGGAGLGLSVCLSVCEIIKIKGPPPPFPFVSLFPCAFRGVLLAVWRCWSQS